MDYNNKLILSAWDAAVRIYRISHKNQELNIAEVLSWQMAISFLKANRLLSPIEISKGM